jgi:hypothetical protein
MPVNDGCDDSSETSERTSAGCRPDREHVAVRQVGGQSPGTNRARSPRTFEDVAEIVQHVLAEER